MGCYDFTKKKESSGCKWGCTLKFNVDGTLEPYKSRLIAKGHIQPEGLDYNETFSPFAKMDTVKLLLKVSAPKRWPLKQHA